MLPLAFGYTCPMEANSILSTYILLALFDLGLASILTALNYRDSWQRRGQVPAELKDKVSPAEALKATDYSRAKMRFSFVENLFSTFVILIAVVAGAFGFLDGWLGGLIGSAYWLGAAFLGFLLAAQTLLSVPFSLYLNFVLEKRFGFNTMKLGTWAFDSIKGLFLGAVIGLPLLFLLYLFMDGTGSLWWLWAAAIFSLIDLILSLLYPLVIAPLFNKFKPMEEGSLKSRIGELADRLSFRVSGIFVMDGSKRSRHSNAYFTGMGRMKRIVLFDTLVAQMSEDELLAVLAHEIGHEKKKHVLVMTAITIASAFLAFWILALCSGWANLYAAFGFAAPSKHALLLMVALISGPATFFLTPVFAALSRRHEYQADGFSAKATSPEALGSALLKLNKENASNLWPNAVYSAWYYSHPALRDRLAAIGYSGKERA
jgi:STE24 endopeptidase